MGESDACRLPVEIWEGILLDIAWNPLIPFKDLSRNSLPTNLVDSIGLFDMRCGAYNDYQVLMSTVAKLRLVCRSWNTILNSYPGLCSMTDLKNVVAPTRSLYHLTNAERVHLDADMIYSCPCSRYGLIFNLWGPKFCPSLDSFIRPREGDTQSQWQKDHITQTMVHPRVKILLLSARGNEPGYVDDILLSAPNLLALSLYLPPLNCWTQARQEALGRITHLSLRSIHYSSLGILLVELNLDNIRWLELHVHLVETDKTQRTPRPSIGKWKFPNIETLSISGCVTDVYREDLKTFMRGCGPTVTGLYIDLTETPMTPLYIDNLGEIFPHLKVYGSSFGSLVHETRSGVPDKFPSLCTVIMSGLILGSRNPKKHADSLISLLVLWNVRDIVLTESWTQWRTQIEFIGAPCLGTGWEFFDIISSSGITVCDWTGASLLSDSGRPLWETMRRQHEINMENPDWIEWSTSEKS